jgi:hypothetical protein
MVPQRYIYGHPTDKENAVLFGTMLADGHLQNRNGSCRMKLEHTSKKEPYITWKCDILQYYCMPNTVPIQQVRKKGNVHYFWTRQTFTFLNVLHGLFYEPKSKVTADGVEKVSFVKTITPKLLKAMPKSPYVLAVLFMDDGSVRDDAYSGKLAMQSYTYEEQLLFAAYLKEVYDLDVNVVKHTVLSGQFYISIPASTFSKLVKIIEPCVREIPCMVYKLNEGRRPFSQYS